MTLSRTTRKMQNGECRMGDCLKEASETDYWLELIAAEQIVAPERLAPLMQETRELIAIFTTIIKKARSQ